MRRLVNQNWCTRSFAPSTFICLKLSSSLRCAHEIYRRPRDKAANRACPACNKILSSRLHLCSDTNGTVCANNENGLNLPNGNVSTAMLNDIDGIISTNEKEHSANLIHPMTTASGSSSTRPFFRSNLSLASLTLRASSLTIDSECHATSSV